MEDTNKCLGVGCACKFDCLRWSVAPKNTTTYTVYPKNKNGTCDYFIYNK